MELFASGAKGNVAVLARTSAVPIDRYREALHA
jgi:hypothetical protein